MGYASLAQCVADLEKTGQLKRIEVEVDPFLELAAIQRRVVKAGGPALLFTRVKGTRFPMLACLFGTMERTRYIFRDTLGAVEALFSLHADIGDMFRHPLKSLPKLMGLLPHSAHLFPRRVPTKSAPLLAGKCGLADLPRLVCWPCDGGAFVTLPMVYTEDPAVPGLARSNLGMYRIQLTGNAYAPDEVGLHYQIHRGIGIHHAHALSRKEPLPVHVFVGGPPALTLASVMPLPEGISELRFAGLLGGRRMTLASRQDFPLPVLAEADFCISGFMAPHTRPEGPFGDHLGYYSLCHEFPCLKVTDVRHRHGAIWPFTTVGRPPQEDTNFGNIIHELTAPLIPRMFSGVEEIHAVDAAGVHPLLLAVGQERYVPYEARRRPRELLTSALHLLGGGQTSLAKYVLIAAREDAPGLSCRDVPAFLRHMLERTDFTRDLHFLTAYNNDSLDYSGGALNEGSKLIWAAAGEKRRDLAVELRDPPQLPAGFGEMRIVDRGVLAIGGPVHAVCFGEQCADMEALTHVLGSWPGREAFPLVTVVDDVAFCADRFSNFLWVAFTRSDPALDIYGVGGMTKGKHWSCSPPLVLDCRAKAFHAPVLEEPPEVVRKVEALARLGGPLHGCF